MGKSFLPFKLIVVAALLLALAACRAPAQEPGIPVGSATQAPTRLVESTIPAQPSPEATQVVESTIPAPPSPTASATPATTTVEEATAMPSATTTPTTSATSVAPAPTRATPGAVVTSEPRVDVWTYGTGMTGAQIEGPLQATIGFLNSLIVDGSGNSSLPYLDPGLHAQALTAPGDGLVLGIDTTYTSFEVNWLGTSGATSKVEARLSYENGARASHLFDLRRNGDAWQIVTVGPE